MIKFERVINVIDAHTFVEAVRFITSGLPQIPGSGTM